MTNITQIFYDAEATSIARTADPISIGLVAILGDGKACTFYAEFTDFDKNRCDAWVIENVVAKLKYPHAKTNCVERIDTVGDFNPFGHNYESLELTGEFDMIAGKLKTWLAQFGEVEFWADYDVIDKPMLIDLIGEFGRNDYGEVVGLPTHLPNVPYYAFYDLHTLLREEGLHPDMSRQDFIAEKGKAIAGEPHNALYDAWVCAYTYLALAERREAKRNLQFLQDRLETIQSLSSLMISPIITGVDMQKIQADVEAQIREAEYVLQKYDTQ